MRGESGSDLADGECSISVLNILRVPALAAEVLQRLIVDCFLHAYIVEGLLCPYACVPAQRCIVPKYLLCSYIVVSHRHVGAASRGSMDAIWGA